MYCCKSTIYYAHGFCELRIQTGHNKDDLSVILNIKGLSWEDSKTGLTQRPEAGTIWRHFNSHTWVLMLDIDWNLSHLGSHMGSPVVSPCGLVWASKFGHGNCVPRGSIPKEEERSA